MTIATVVYDYAKDRWDVFAIDLTDGSWAGASYGNKLFNEYGKYRFPCIIDVPVKSFDLKDGRYSVKYAEDFEFPEVVTLEQSIENNRKFLSQILNSL